MRPKWTEEFVRPPAAAVRHAARMTVAALVAFESARLLNLSQGYWAVISAMVIMQGSLGGTLIAGIDRVVATLAGAIAGAAGVWLRGELPVPPEVILVLTMAPVALLAVIRPNFRVAPLTAAIVLLIGPPGHDAMNYALRRVLEIALGCAIGIVTAQLVLPSPARKMVAARAASILEILGELAAAHLVGPTLRTIDSLNEEVRRQLVQLETSAAEDARERGLFSSAAAPTQLPRALRRIRSDVAFLGRAMTRDAAGIDRAAVAASLGSYLTQAAAAVRGTGAAPSLNDVHGEIAQQEPGSALHFVLITLERDLAELETTAYSPQARRSG